MADPIPQEGRQLTGIDAVAGNIEDLVVYADRQRDSRQAEDFRKDLAQ
jgi:hypothetical protein